MKRGMFAVAVWMLTLATPAVAAQKPKGGHAKPVAAKPAVQHASPAPKSTAKTHAKTTVKVQSKTHAKPVKTSTKSSTKTSVKAVKTKSTVAKTEKASKTSRKTTANSDTTTTGTTSTSTTSTTTLSPVQQKLKQNTNLAAKLQGRLPAGTDLMTAASGFRNLGQFVSAVNASYNHGLSFAELKQRIVVQGMSLGQASQDMRRSSTTSGQTTTARRQ